MAQEKKKKDATKKRCNRKILEREALLKRRRQQRLVGLPEESLSETASGEDDGDDDGDDDAELWYDTTTSLAHLPDMRFMQEPAVRGSTSQTSRVASTPIEGEEEQTVRRAPQGPSGKGSTELAVLPSLLVGPR
jgi:hypothetical protein